MATDIVLNNSKAGHSVAEAGHGAVEAGANVASAGHGVVEAGHTVASAGHGVAEAGANLASVGHGVVEAGANVASVGHGVVEAGHAVANAGHTVAEAGASAGHTVASVGHAVAEAGAGLVIGGFSIQMYAIFIFMSLASISSIMAVASRNTLKTGAFMGVFSVSCAASYFFLNAPDVALTETSINALFGTLLYIVTIKIGNIGRFFEVSDSPQDAGLARVKRYLLYLLVIMIFSLPFVIALEYLWQFGHRSDLSYGREFLLHYLPSLEAEKIVMVNNTISEYVSSSVRFQIPNVVTTTLASARGFDTMCESVVILTAGIGVLLILKNFGAHGYRDHDH